MLIAWTPVVVHFRGNWVFTLSMVNLCIRWAIRMAGLVRGSRSCAMFWSVYLVPGSSRLVSYLAAIGLPTEQSSLYSHVRDPLPCLRPKAMASSDQGPLKPVAKDKPFSLFKLFLSYALSHQGTLTGTVRVYICIHGCLGYYSSHLYFLISLCILKLSRIGARNATQRRRKLAESVFRTHPLYLLKPCPD